MIKRARPLSSPIVPTASRLLSVNENKVTQLTFPITYSWQPCFNNSCFSRTMSVGVTFANQNSEKQAPYVSSIWTLITGQPNLVFVYVFFILFEDLGNYFFKNFIQHDNFIKQQTTVYLKYTHIWNNVPLGVFERVRSTLHHGTVTLQYTSIACMARALKRQGVWRIYLAMPCSPFQKLKLSATTVLMKT